MELIAVAFLVALADPVRWLISIFSAWLVPSHVGAIALSILVTSGLMLALTSGNPLSLVVGAIASTMITSAFFLLRRKLRNKKLQRKESESTA